MRGRVRPGGVILLAVGAVACAAPSAAQEPLSWGRMQSELLDHPTAPPLARIPYGPGEHQFGELRLPLGPGPHPVLVVLHGGCWLSIADLTYMDPFSEALTQAGWATWSLEFRRIDQDGGGWPAILEDVAAGTDHLRELVRDYPLDTTRVVAAGHSSGGHLALWLSSRARLPADGEAGPRLRGTNPLPLKGALGLAPIADLADYTRYTRCGPTIVPDFLGRDVDPASERFRLSDPASLAPAPSPQLILLGALDPIVPPAHGANYGERAAEAGAAVEVITMEEAGHFELVAPWTPAWPRLAARIHDFLARVGGGGPR